MPTRCNELPVLLFHPGKQHSPQTALALQQLGRLKSYATSIFYAQNRMPYLLGRLPGPLGRRLNFEFSRFENPEIDPALVRTWGVYEWLERLALRVGANKLSYSLDRWGNRRFALGLKRDLKSNDPFAVWGYNGAAADAFRMARAQGRICILDRTIGDYRYYNSAMRVQRAAYPQYFSAAEGEVSEQQVMADEEEYELADVILVGSDYCAKTLIDHSSCPGIAKKIRVIPYCCNSFDFRSDVANIAPTSGPIRFLFAGRLTPRKGIHLALEAISRFDKSEANLTLVGKMLIPESAFAPFANRVNYVPSVAPGEVAKVMHQHDVLVLPSFFEGSAITMLEAMNCGLGIIQSKAAGNGASPRSGIVLEDNSADHLYQAMRQAVQNRQMVEDWKMAAFSESKRYSFQAYRDNIASMLDETLDGKGSRE